MRCGQPHHLSQPAFEQITGYSEEEVCGQRPSMLKSGLHDQAFYADMYHALERVGCGVARCGTSAERKLYPPAADDQHPAGRAHQPVHRHLQRPLPDQAGGAKIAAQANYDNLTGLPNRWLFGRCLSRFCERGERFALMVLDLNNFKAVNNSMDHHAGDALLRRCRIGW